MFGEKRKYVVTDDLGGSRLDLVMVELERGLSRQYLQKLIKDKRLKSGNKVMKASQIVRSGQVIVVDYPPTTKTEMEPVPMPLTIVYEDSDLVVVDKEPGMVVHPGVQGQFLGKTLVNAMLAHVGEGLAAIGGVLRPGIVHRLDKDTSGLIVVAKNDFTHQELSKQFRHRKVEKYYMALVCGTMSMKHGLIDFPIGRSQKNRKLMAIDGIRSREARTEYWLEKQLKIGNEKYSLLKIKLHSGRTHQIRVHFSAIGHPLVGDRQYGRKAVNNFFENKFSLKRQFLHSFRLKLVQPKTKKTIDLSVNLPSDLQLVMTGMEEC